MSRRVFAITLASATLGGTISVARAGELPPADSKPLSEIIKALEDAGVGVITSVEFEEGLWEVQTRKQGKWVELYVDPKTGDVKRREPDDADDDLPPADGKPLSAIVRLLELEKLGVITSVEFDDGYWEVKIRQGSRKIKVDVDPKTGARRR